MSEQTHKDIIKENFELLHDYANSNRREWLQNAVDDEQFYLGDQWTQDEIKELESRGQAPLVVNRVYPILKQKEAQLAANNPRFLAQPRETGDIGIANTIVDLLEYIWTESSGKRVMRNVTRNSLVKGMGILYAYFDKYADYGRGEVRIGSLRPEEVFIDPTCKDETGKDAQNIIVYKELTENVVRRTFPEHADELLKKPAGGSREFEESGSNQTIDGKLMPSDISTEEDLFRLVERYTIIKKKHYVVKAPDGTEDLYDEDEYRALKVQFATQKLLDPSIQYDLDLNTATIYLDRCRVVANLEDTLLHDTILPISYLPIILVPNEWTGTPYPLSDVRFIRSMQKEINKRRSLMISHASLSTNPRLHVTKGSTPYSMEDLERRWARPGASIEHFAGMDKPEQDAPLPLPTALYQLENEAKYDTEYTLGVFALSQGSSEAAPDTFRATLAIEEFGNRRMQLIAENINLALGLLGKVVGEMIQAYYTDHKIINITGGDGLNKRVEVNDNSGERDVTKGHYNIYYIGGSTLASNRVARLQLAMELYEKGLVDDIEVYKYIEGLDVNELMRRKSKLAQTTQALEQTTQQAQELFKENQQLNDKIEELEKQAILDEYELKLKTELNNMKIENKNLKAAESSLKRVATEAKKANKENTNNGKTS